MNWLEEVLGGFVDGPTTKYLCRPSQQQPQLLVPLTPSRVTQTSMRRDHDDRDLKERAQGTVAQVIARLGVLRFAGGEVLELPPFGLVRDLEIELGEKRLLATISLGPRRRNRKPVIQLIRPDGTPVAFVKVGWSGLTRELVTNEAHWLEHVKGRLPAGVAAPEVLARKTTDQVDAIATTPLPVKAGAKRTASVPTKIVREMALLSSAGPLALSQLTTVKQWSDNAVGELLNTKRLLEKHGDIVLETGMWHGDLTPWNTASSGGLMYLWDWEFAGDHRPIGFDALHECFERTRRASANNEQAALDSIIRDAGTILEPYLQSPQISRSSDVVQACIDLYLCELIAREFRLAGEGWEPQNLGPLDELALATLQQRLAQ